eukprot:CAMPEP_0168468224 /NCGR_PEP_ID=MMETSP0228-20121227/57594_1 /TAXON_ID=133427 /ORGANISM="Protoceratium reticulatum, Strain CCCM 535 (=CCMP 1889)" /LENGTH=100 /DNA_ID=CAMNT_0008483971 /DNA_START=74 /DNA_END=373 /DNA_ORIENTATION=-
MLLPRRPPATHSASCLLPGVGKHRPSACPSPGASRWTWPGRCDMLSSSECQLYAPGVRGSQVDGRILHDGHVEVTGGRRLRLHQQLPRNGVAGHPCADKR